MTTLASARALRYDDIAIGDRASFQHVIVREDVDAFAALTGDRNPLHVDDDYARETRFGRPVVHGLLTQSFLSRLVGMQLPGKHALILAVESKFRRPAFVGDRLTLRAIVTGRVDVGRLLVIAGSIDNQHDERLVDAELKVQVIEPGAKASPR